MKKLLAIMLFIAASVTFTQAQEQVELSFEEEPTNAKSFDGYVLNLNNNFLEVPQWRLPKFELMPQFKPLNPQLYQMNMNGAKYGTSDFTYSSLNNLSYWGVHNGIDGPINSATFQLNNGLKISTYGDYDANGYRKKLPSAYPWKNNDFRGGFELKSNNGKFGIKVEVEQRRTNPYGPHW